MGNPSKLGEVATHAIGGVSIKRHILDLEAGSLAHITRRIGRRLARWLRETPEMVPGHRVIWEEGRPTVHPILNNDGTPVLVPCIPDEDFRETYKLYSSTLINLLKEQRERAKLKPGKGAPAISDEEYERGAQEFLLEAIRTMPEDELRKLLDARKVPAPEPIDVAP